MDYIRVYIGNESQFSKYAEPQLTMRTSLLYGESLIWPHTHYSEYS